MLSPLLTPPSTPPGSRVVSEHILLDDPAAMCVFYTDNRRPHTPAVAVAGGRYVFIYRNLRYGLKMSSDGFPFSFVQLTEACLLDYRPYFKFSLPSLPVADAEVKVWQQVKAGEITVPPPINCCINNPATASITHTCAAVSCSMIYRLLRRLKSLARRVTAAWN